MISSTIINFKLLICKHIQSKSVFRSVSLLSRLVKPEKCEFTIVNDHFEGKHNKDSRLAGQTRIKNQPETSSEQYLLFQHLLSQNKCNLSLSWLPGSNTSLRLMKYCPNCHRLHLLYLYP